MPSRTTTPIVMRTTRLVSSCRVLSWSETDSTGLSFGADISTYAR
jgi:hypothetical protein